MCVRVSRMRPGGPVDPSDFNEKDFGTSNFTGSDIRGGNVGVSGMEDEYDPYEGTGQTAQDQNFLGQYDDSDQSNPVGGARPFSGLTAAQKKELQERDTFLSRKILAAHEAALKGDTKKGAYGFVTNPKTGQVVGYTHRANPMGIAALLGSLGSERVFQTYTGQSQFNPFNQDAVNKLKGINTDDNDDTPQAKTPLDPCPEGFKFNEETQSCEKVETTDEEQILGTNYVRALSPMPDLSTYGIEGGEYKFFSEMPGIIKAKDGLPRQPHGEVKGPGGPKDDLVGPILLSAQEYVEPYERVLDEGNGDYERGIRVLEKKRMAALRKYRDRVKSEERNRA